METNKKYSIKKLITQLDWDAPYSTQDLIAFGLRATQAAYLAESGWLKRLGRGAYQVPNGRLDRDKSIAFLSAKIAGLHMGGKTALAWRGVRHNLANEERLLLWGDKSAQIPNWFTQSFNAAYQTTKIFDKNLPSGYGIAPLPGGHQEVMVSTPERALLELFSDTGKFQSLEETMKIAEGTRNLRLDALETLLTHTIRVKIVRLAKAFAEEFELPWADVARKHSERLGSAARWIAVTRDKQTLSLKK